jgi:hypothetical protein
MMKPVSSIKHLKLITGEELVCNLLEESPDNIVVNNALSLIEKNLSNGDKYYAFKTYMVYQDSPRDVIMIFSDKILSLALPTQEMIRQYGNAIKEMELFANKSELEDDFQEDLSLEEFLNDMEQDSLDIDSDTSGMTIN